MEKKLATPPNETIEKKVRILRYHLRIWRKKEK